MQQHPVPQNIINFQFKLVGDMTLKQFGYLAGGIILGILASKLPYPSFFNYTLAGLFAFSGFALAFLPIEDRPLDIWVKNFVISIFSATQFVYKKTGGNLDFLNIDLTRDAQNAAVIIEKNLKQDRYRDYLGTLTSATKSTLDAPINQYLKTLKLDDTTAPMLQTQNISTTRQANVRPTNTFEEVKIRPLAQTPISTVKKEDQASAQFQTIRLSSQNQPKTVFVKDTYRAPLAEIKSKNVSFDYLKQKAQTAEPTRNPEEDERKKKEMVTQKLQEIQKKQAVVHHDLNGQITGQTIDVSNIKRIYQTPQTPKTPNIICGTILDQNDEPVRSAILEIKNSYGAAERTLKTNSIGQFVTMTPLENGKYTITIEKSGYSFDNINIILDNKIVEPLLIRAK